MSVYPIKYMSEQEQFMYTNWNTLPKQLKSEETRWVAIDCNGYRWDLAGPLAGRQGVVFGEELQGHLGIPFEHLLTESAYQIGATYERTNILKRIINAGILIGAVGGRGRPLNAHQYRMVESRWWSGWPIGQTGWLGSHTWLHGWRWIPVMWGEPLKNSQKKDATYAGNNCASYDMQFLAVRPWYSKRVLIEPFTARTDGDSRTIAIANRGDMPQWYKALYSGPGQAWVQDGMLSDRQIELPEITAKDGPVLCDTDEAARTLTASSDPVDNEFYRLVRSAKILDFFLHDIGELGLPVWRRASDVRFTSMIPPRTIANIKVKHSKAGGTVHVMMPQWFTRPY
ncbi:MAG: hypothetical protein ACRDTI_20840 [Mycobacterium sp.]